jgi:hypothetical protein
MGRIYTTKTGAKVLGVKQDTLKRYAWLYGIGSQPGGKNTPWLFTEQDLIDLRGRSELKWEKVEAAEDRDELGLGPLYNPDTTPRS